MTADSPEIEDTSEFRARVLREMDEEALRGDCKRLLGVEGPGPATGVDLAEAIVAAVDEIRECGMRSKSARYRDGIGDALSILSAALTAVAGAASGRSRG